MYKLKDELGTQNKYELCMLSIYVTAAVLRIYMVYWYMYIHLVLTTKMCQSIFLETVPCLGISLSQLNNFIIRCYVIFVYLSPYITQ